MRAIPFNRVNPKALLSKDLLDKVEETRGGKNGAFNAKVRKYISDHVGALEVFLTPSCTSALEMAFLLVDLQPKDEVIVPAFNFTSGCLPIINSGAIPIFVDVCRENFSIDARLVSEACTERTKAIMWTNYGGAIPDIDELRKISDERNLILVEDNAHGFGIKVEDLALGSLGHLSAHSFHETKNLQCGEGGSLQVNIEKYLERSDYLSEKGTNRERFKQGSIEKYEWVDKGGSFLLAELLAAILFGQLQEFNEIQLKRKEIYRTYKKELKSWADENFFEIPFHSKYREEAAHLFYLIAPSVDIRRKFIQHLEARGITALFHYQDLSRSPAGLRWGKAYGHLENTKIAADQLVRLPMWPMSQEEVSYVVEMILEYDNNAS